MVTNEIIEVAGKTGMGAAVAVGGVSLREVNGVLTVIVSVLTAVYFIVSIVKKVLEMRASKQEE